MKYNLRLKQNNNKKLSFFIIEDDLKYLKMEDDLGFLTMEDEFKYLKIEEDLNFWK